VIVENEDPTNAVLMHFGLQEQPFGVTPDPKYLFPSPTHREALASLAYGVNSGRGFFALIARPGMGKTTLLFHLLQQLEGSSRTVFLFQPNLSERDFLRSLLGDLGMSDYGGDLVQIQRALNEVLLYEAHLGRRFVVVIDEAQNLDFPVLELVRMLSNFETPHQKLMQIILAGQPQLAGKLASHHMTQLRQRLSLITHLEPLSAKETSTYMAHRLAVAGFDFKTPLFTAGSRYLVAHHSKGIPRNINNLCFNALSLSYAMGLTEVNERIIEEVVADQDLGAIIDAQVVRPGVAVASSPLPPRTARGPSSGSSSLIQVCSWLGNVATYLNTWGRESDGAEN
jgi:general secretion pathway protein A